MAYSKIIKEKATNLRRLGFSLNEIYEKIGVSKSVISGWTKSVDLDDFAKNRILARIKSGQLISANKKREKTKEKLAAYKIRAITDLDKINLDKVTARIICSLMYWCEGGKNQFNGVRFTNSDPKLIKSFLYLFRYGFDLDENKFRVCVHLHEYHDSAKQINFWARVTSIPKNQFIKPFLKQNTGKSIKRGYPGCADIRYHSNDIAKQLLIIAESFLLKYDGGIG